MQGGHPKVASSVIVFVSPPKKCILLTQPFIPYELLRGECRPAVYMKHLARCSAEEDMQPRLQKAASAKREYLSIRPLAAVVLGAHHSNASIAFQVHARTVAIAN